MSLKEKDDDLRPSDVESVNGLALYVADVDRPYAMKCELSMFFSVCLVNYPMLNTRPVNKCLQDESVHLYRHIQPVP